MKRYTTQEQTRKLKELGFAAPVGPHPIEDADEKLSVCTIYPTYELAELIEILPYYIEGCKIERGRKGYTETAYLSITPELWHKPDVVSWFVAYTGAVHNAEPVFVTEKVELIDAVFEMIVELKEKKIL